MLRFDVPLAVVVDAFWMVKRAEWFEVHDPYSCFECPVDFGSNTTSEDGASSPFADKLVF
jgi:hypothetical protein